MTDPIVKAVVDRLYGGDEDTAPIDSAKVEDTGEPVAIYQLKLASGDWRDQDESAYRNNLKHFPDDVRIVYATCDAAPSDAIKPREVKRDSDFSIMVVFASCRLASEFERQMIVASAPRGKS